MHIYSGRPLLTAAFVAALLVSGCSDSKDKNNTSTTWSCSSSPTDSAPLNSANVQVQFPPAVARTLTDTIEVRGITKDTTQVANIYVNNELVTSDDDLASWSINVPLVSGTNAISVVTEDPMGQRSTIDTLTVTQSAEIVTPQALVVDDQNGRMLMLDAGYQAITSIDPETGSFSRFSPLPGTENLLVNATSLILDTERNRLLVIQKEKTEEDSMPEDDIPPAVTVHPYIAIDLTTGEQSIFAYTPPANTILANSPGGISLDGDTAYVSDLELVYRDKDGKRVPKGDATAVINTIHTMILTMDLTTGQMAVLASVDYPSILFPINEFVAMTTSAESDDLYVFDRTATGLGMTKIAKADGKRTPLTLDIRIEPETTTEKTRAICANADNLEIGTPRGLLIDDENKRLLIVSSNRQILAMNLDPISVLASTTHKVSAVASDNVCAFPQDATPPTSPYNFKKLDTLALDTVTNTLYTVDDGLDALLAIDGDTSAREWIAGAAGDDPGGLKSFNTPSCLALAEQTGQVLVCDKLIATVFGHNLATGVKTVRATSANLTTGSQAKILYPLSAGYCPSNETFLIMDDNNQRPPNQLNPSKGWPRLVSLDATGKMEIVYSFDSRSPMLRDLAFDSERNVAYVADSRRYSNAAGDVIDGNLIHELTFTTGNVKKRVLTDQNSPDTAYVLKGLKSIALDKEHNRLLALDTVFEGLIAVDLVTGVRTPLSTKAFPETGGGPEMQNPQSVIVDAANNRALVIESSLNAILAVDLDSGVREIVFPTNGTNTEGLLTGSLLTGRDLALHPDGYLLVIDDTSDTLVAIDLETQQLVTLAR